MFLVWNFTFKVTSVYLQDTTPDELLSAVMSAVLTDVGLSPDQLGDVCVGEDRFFALTLTYCIQPFISKTKLYSNSYNNTNTWDFNQLR